MTRTGVADVFSDDNVSVLIRTTHSEPLPRQESILGEEETQLITTLRSLARFSTAHGKPIPVPPASWRTWKKLQTWCLPVLMTVYSEIFPTPALSKAAEFVTNSVKNSLLTHDPVSHQESVDAVRVWLLDIVLQQPLAVCAYTSPEHLLTDVDSNALIELVRLVDQMVKKNTGQATEMAQESKLKAPVEVIQKCKTVEVEPIMESSKKRVGNSTSEHYSERDFALLKDRIRYFENRRLRFEEYACSLRHSLQRTMAAVLNSEAALHKSCSALPTRESRPLHITEEEISQKESKQMILTLTLEQRREARRLRHEEFLKLRLRCQLSALSKSMSSLPPLSPRRIEELKQVESRFRVSGAVPFVRQKLVKARLESIIPVKPTSPSAGNARENKVEKTMTNLGLTEEPEALLPEGLFLSCHDHMEDRDLVISVEGFYIPVEEITNTSDRSVVPPVVLENLEALLTPLIRRLFDALPAIRCGVACYLRPVGRERKLSKNRPLLFNFAIQFSWKRIRQVPSNTHTNHFEVDYRDDRPIIRVAWERSKLTNWPRLDQLETRLRYFLTKWVCPEPLLPLSWQWPNERKKFSLLQVPPQQTRNVSGPMGYVSGCPEWGDLAVSHANWLTSRLPLHGICRWVFNLSTLRPHLRLIPFHSHLWVAKLPFSVQNDLPFRRLSEFWGELTVSGILYEPASMLCEVVAPVFPFQKPPAGYIRVSLPNITNCRQKSKGVVYQVQEDDCHVAGQTEVISIDTILKLFVSLLRSFCRLRPDLTIEQVATSLYYPADENFATTQLSSRDVERMSVSEFCLHTRSLVWYIRCTSQQPLIDQLHQLYSISVLQEIATRYMYHDHEEQKSDDESQWIDMGRLLLAILSEMHAFLEEEEERRLAEISQRLCDEIAAELAEVDKEEQAAMERAKRAAEAANAVLLNSRAKLLPSESDKDSIPKNSLAKSLTIVLDAPRRPVNLPSLDTSLFSPTTWKLPSSLPSFSSINGDDNSDSNSQKIWDPISLTLMSAFVDGNLQSSIYGIGVDLRLSLSFGGKWYHSTVTDGASRSSYCCVFGVRQMSDLPAPSENESVLLVLSVPRESTYSIPEHLHSLVPFASSEELDKCSSLEELQTLFTQHGSGVNCVAIPASVFRQPSFEIHALVNFYQPPSSSAILNALSEAGSLPSLGNSSPINGVIVVDSLAADIAPMKVRLSGTTRVALHTNRFLSLQVDELARFSFEPLLQSDDEDEDEFSDDEKTHETLDRLAELLMDSMSDGSFVI